MNNAILLFHNPEIGYVIQLVKTGKIELGYQIIRISFFEDEFVNFLKCLLYLEIKYTAVVDIYQKQITIHTPDPSLELVLSLRELLQLKEMVEKADNERIAQSLMAGLRG